MGMRLCCCLCSRTRYRDGRPYPALFRQGPDEIPSARMRSRREAFLPFRRPDPEAGGAVLPVRSSVIFH